MKRDLHSNINTLPSINPAAAITANGTTTGATIDGSGYESVEHVVQSGTITDGTFTGHLYAGDAANMSDEVEVTASSELIGAVPTFAATDDNVVKRVGYRGSKRYSRIKMVQAGATTGGFLSATAILGHPRVAPVP
jgi:hypothetical protein